MKTLIKNGTLITAADTQTADLLIDGEKIAMIGFDLPADDARLVDASGMLLMPGGIDVHTHMELPLKGTTSSDDFYSGQKAAAFGGTTCHIDFANQAKGESLAETVEKWNRKAAGKSVIDYGYHITITDGRPEVLDELPAMAAEGVSSLKLLMAYKGLFQVDDSTLFRVMAKAEDLGMLVMVHAENGDSIDLLIKDALEKGKRATEWHALTRPAWAEAEATLRAIAIAGMTGAPLYVVHMTCEEAVDQLTYGRERGLRVMGETCPQYLFFTVDELRRPDGAKWVCSPPMRTKKDNEFLWKALASDKLQVVSTDHCPFFFDGTQPIQYEGRPFQLPGKELGEGDFSKIPNGVPGVEDRQLILWSYGVGQGRISPNRFVELTATNPAKIFGLYPRKGSLTVGADADIAIWDPAAKRVMTAATLHQRTDYSLYEGWEIAGAPAKVFVRGNLLVDGDAWHGRPGSGQFVKRSTHGEIV